MSNELCFKEPRLSQIQRPQHPEASVMELVATPFWQEETLSGDGEETPRARLKSLTLTVKQVNLHRHGIVRG